MQPLDVRSAPLDRSSLIEASAGTGKTFTLEQLFLRFVTGECGKRTPLGVDEILVVTYTEKACEELRFRVRRTLLQALAAEETREKRQLLRTALEGFDRAAVHTIHAFCRRMLSDFALESGGPFTAEIFDPGPRLVSATADFFRRQSPETDVETLRDFLREFPGEREVIHGLKILLKTGAVRGGVPGVRVVPSEQDLSEMVRPQTREEIERRILFLADRLKESLAPGEDIEAELHAAGMKTKPPVRALRRTLEEFAEASNMESRFAAGRELEKRVRRNGLRRSARPPRWLDAYEPLREALSTHRRLREDQSRARAWLLLFGLARGVYDSLERRKILERAMTYDDMVERLHRALLVERRPEFVRALRSRYRAALVDESQDTDRYQWDLFRALFLEAEQGGTLWWVGDPKQAIYRFRGADLSVYFEASEALDRKFVLDTNYRATPELVEALNRLFAHGPLFPRNEKPDFRPVRAAPGRAGSGIVRGKDPVPPVAFLELPPALAADRARDRLGQRIACEAAALLSKDTPFRVRTPEGTRRISPGDIAVLTRTNRECLEMQEHLGKRGIPSSIRKQEGLFRSAEAWDLRVFLDAVDHPRDPGRLRLFLGCGLAGKNYREIPEMTDAEYESWQALFIRLNRLFEEGFAVLCRVAFSELDVLSKWIALPGGERRAANLHRIFEIVNERQSRMDLSLAECVEQIDRWIEEADPEHLQPMERDRESVVVMTVHSSKGLEFPVVFLGGGIGRLSARRGEEVFYTENRTRIFDLWGTNAGRERRDVESLAEMRRLLYVAMTRAKYRLSLPLFEPGPRSGCLANLLRPEGEGGPEWLRFLERPENRPYFEIKGHGDGIPAGTVAPRAGTPPALRAPRCFSRDFRKAPAFRVASFTGIVQGPGAEFENSAVQGPGEPARTDASVDELFASPAEPSPGDAALPLPRGARTGSMLHEVLEHLDFSIARPFQRFEEFAGDGETRGRIEDRVVPALKRFDLPPELFPSVLEILWHVLKCPLSGAAGELFTLEEVEERRHEVEFYLPVHPVSRLRTELDVSGDDPVSIRLSWNARMLKGVMDLVFRHRGRYYLADWKSNDLGDGPAAYAPRHLGAAMKRHHYPLQYWIYLAALERLLARQHPGFDYDRHFGGVFYLFVRGMREHDPRFGVYRHTPSRGALRRFAKDLFPETAGDGFETKGDVS